MEHYPNACGDQPLLIKHLLVRTLRWAPHHEIVYRDLTRHTYLEFAARIQRLAHALTRLGVRRGDRIGVLEHDSHRYLELFFAIPMIGAVLHTVNTRLSPEQTLYTLNHAEDSLLLIHPDFVPLIEVIAPRLTTVRAWVLLTDDHRRPTLPLPCAAEYEEALAAASPNFDFPDFDERTVATLFYTTGTTGDPKGVFFTHRQLVLHTMSAGWTLAAHNHPRCLRVDDVYMPLTPMFHVHAWGVPYAATALGLKQVYAGRYEPHLLLKLLVEHQVTFTHCVPAILQMLLHHPEAARTNLRGLKVMIGGSALPKGLARLAMDRGITIVGGYGMSETCPIIGISQMKSETIAQDPDATLDIVTRTGFPTLLVDSAIMSPDGSLLPQGPAHVGELVLRTPWLTTGYYKEPAKSADLWRDGWLHTGDIAYIDTDGYIRITDRLKDVIKIGGEWISSLELENALSQHPAVRDVAVVGVPNPKWDENPHAEVVLRDEARGTVTSKDLLKHLHTFIDRGLIHKRAILTEIRLVESIPRTSVGKLDKKTIRQSLAQR